MADLALDILARECPNLLQLSLFISKYLKHNHQTFQDLLGPIPDTPYIQSLSKLTHLVEITCAIGFLRDNIPVIGTLPELEHITLFSEDRSTVIRPDAIPSRSFSALRSLELLKLAHWQVISLLNVPRLVKQITRLKINHEIHSRVDLDDFSDEPEQIADQGEYLASEILPWLKNVPRLSYLELKLIFTSKVESETDIGRQCLVDTFSVLPLETFILSGGHISNWTRSMDTLPTIWPHLTRLELWEQIVRLNDLPCFARLPNLEYLLLGVVFEKVEKTTNELSLSPLRKLKCVNRISDEQLDYITHSGGFLLALFPRLRGVEWTYEEPRVKYGFQVLNRHIMLHLASEGK
ncbi:F-box protein [Ceratobasidium sp. AG-Ba]|nr:F-box protein [Ceratobasidium sp. AG-Ba]